MAAFSKLFRPPTLQKKLSLLKHLLSNLPPSVPQGSKRYQFDHFSPDQDRVDESGSIPGGVSSTLEIIFGTREGGQLIEFEEQGASLTAVVDVLDTYITSGDGEEILLIKWLDDLPSSDPIVVWTDDCCAAWHAQIPEREEISAVGASSQHAVSGANPAKRKQAGSAAVERDNRKKAKKDRADAIEKTAQDVRLFDIEGKQRTTGRPPNEVISKLVIACKVRSTGKSRYRCSADGCHQSWASRQASRILNHAVHECNFISSELKQLGLEHAAELSSGAKVDKLDEEAARKKKANTKDAAAGPIARSGQPSVFDAAVEGGRAAVQDRWEHCVLRLLCAASAPSSLLDYDEWKECFEIVNPKIKPFCSTTFTDIMVPLESARVLQLSLKKLRKGKNLTISFDGGTTRDVQSIYTVHVTTAGPKREVHLVEGNEASGVSHTAEHIKDVLLKVIDEIGRDRFAGICSDSTGNTRLARVLIAKEIPSIIILADPCHQLNLLAKDICKLDYFSLCISQMKKVIQFFKKSSFGSRHLKAMRVRAAIGRGLESIGKTRFSTIYYAAVSVLRCLPVIKELIKEGVIDVRAKSQHPLHFLNSASSALQFELYLSQMTAVLAPVAKATKCLEAVESTVADVYLYWLAIMATFRDLFLSENDDSLSLPMGLIYSIRSLINARYREMIEGPGKEIYLAGFFLNPRYVTSTILRRHDHNPLGTRVVIRRTTNKDAGSSEPSPHPDDDLRASIPCYVKLVNYLGDAILKNLIADAPAELFEDLDGPQDIWNEFQHQIAQYARMEHPFNRGLSDNLSPFKYWSNLSHHNDSKLLAHVALKIYSVCPNSMGEERTVSNFTKLNQADRANLKPATMVGMTRIKQHNRRQDGKVKQRRSGGIPVKFRDLTEFIAPSPDTMRNSPQPGTAGDTAETPLVLDNHAEVNSNDLSKDPGTNDSEQRPSMTDEGDPLQAVWSDLDEHKATDFTGRSDVFEVEADVYGDDGADGDGVDLTEPGLRDLLSDIPILSTEDLVTEKEAPRTKGKAVSGFRKKAFDPKSIQFRMS